MNSCYWKFLFLKLKDGVFEFLVCFLILRRIVEKWNWYRRETLPPTLCAMGYQLDQFAVIKEGHINNIRKLNDLIYSESKCSNLEGLMWDGKNYKLNYHILFFMIVKLAYDVNQTFSQFDGVNNLYVIIGNKIDHSYIMFDLKVLKLSGTKREQHASWELSTS